MKIVIATDAWSPQVNGVVTTLKQTRDELRRQGHEVLLITPQGRRGLPCPTYPEIRLTVFAGRNIRSELKAFAPDCVHIATEGSIGWTVRRYCIRQGIPFTSAYHTQLPEYIRARAPIPVSWSVAILRRFHSKSARVMVPTHSIRDLLEERGFERVVIWSRGVQTERFRPQPKFQYDLPRPVWVNVGRVAVEKNIEAFLDLELPGSKVIIGDGPDKDRLQAAYPDCHFLGYKFGDELSQLLAGADVFVFPSKTDTFGLVMLEAMACGLPVAAYPVTGPIDVIRHGVTGAMNHRLLEACRSALTLERCKCRTFAESRSWTRATSEFVSHLEVSSGIQAQRALEHTS
tara:strand:+ start:2010 stop:3044 length:1035 start_codon:yes stop_codon:yes gene_type:complete